MKRTVLLVVGLVAILLSIVIAAVPQLINFQGILRDGSGNPVANGPYSVTFTIYDAATAGTNLWAETQTVNTVNGLFTVLLGSLTPVLDSVFNDSSRYLGVKVGADPEMTPRQRLSSVGYGYVSSQWTSAGQNLFRLNGRVGIGNSSPVAKLDVVTSGSLPSGNVITGVASFAENNSTGSAFGISGIGSTSFGEAYGGYFTGSSPSGNSYGVYGSGNTFGIYGSGNNGVYGYGSSVGVKGTSATTGVYGDGTSYGVYGNSVITFGVVGVGGTRGVTGIGGTYGVYGVPNIGGGFGVYGGNGGIGSAWGGWFDGDVRVNLGLQVIGNVSKGGGSFKIDHPLDPANKYLYHSFVESPDMMNIYNGNVVTDAKGNAMVTLPEWFGALNRDFRYQLTVIGQFAQAIVSKEIADNQFSIQTDKPSVKVSWQVTGIRQDAYAEAHRIPVEEVKSGKERGKYLHPKEHGVPETLGMNYEMTQKLAAEHKQMEEQRTKMEAERKQNEEQRGKMEQERLIQEQKVKENQPNR